MPVRLNHVVGIRLVLTCLHHQQRETALATLATLAMAPWAAQVSQTRSMKSVIIILNRHQLLSDDAVQYQCCLC